MRIGRSSLVTHVRIDQVWSGFWKPRVNERLEEHLIDSSGRLIRPDSTSLNVSMQPKGFECSWSGGIIWPGLVARDGRMVTGAVCKPRPTEPNQKAGTDEFDGSLRQVYKGLLTRGMRETGLYAVLSATRKLLSELVRRWPALDGSSVLVIE